MQIKIFRSRTLMSSWTAVRTGTQKGHGSSSIRLNIEQYDLHVLIEPWNVHRFRRVSYENTLAKELNIEKNCSSGLQKKMVVLTFQFTLREKMKSKDWIACLWRETTSAEIKLCGPPQKLNCLFQGCMTNDWGNLLNNNFEKDFEKFPVYFKYKIVF